MQFQYRILHQALDVSDIHTSYTAYHNVYLYTSCANVIQAGSWLGATEVVGTLGSKVTVPNSDGALYFSSLNDTICSLTKFYMTVTEGNPSMISVDQSNGQVGVQVSNQVYKFTVKACTNGTVIQLEECVDSQTITLKVTPYCKDIITFGGWTGPTSV